MAANTQIAAQVMTLLSQRMPKANWKRVGAMVWRLVDKAEKPDPQYIAEKVVEKVASADSATV